MCQHLGQVFKLVLGVGSPEVLKVVNNMFLDYLDACPEVAAALAGRADPDNPLNCLVERGELTRLLAEAEQYLNGHERNYERAASAFKQVLDEGLDNPEQLERAARGCAICKLTTELRPRDQRRVLKGLASWLKSLKTAEQCLGCTAEVVSTQVERIIEELSPPANRPGSTGAGEDGKPGEEPPPT